MTDALQKAMRTAIVIDLLKVLDTVNEYKKLWEDRISKEEKAWLNKVENSVKELLKPFYGEIQ